MSISNRELNGDPHCNMRIVPAEVLAKIDAQATKSPMTLEEAADLCLEGREGFVSITENYHRRNNTPFHFPEERFSVVFCFPAETVTYQAATLAEAVAKFQAAHPLNSSQAVQECRARMATYTPEQRQELDTKLNEQIAAHPKEVQP